MICKDICAASREGFVTESLLENQRHLRLNQVGTRWPGKHRIHRHGLNLQHRGLEQITVSRSGRQQYR